MATILLFESASGYALFDKKENEEIGASVEAVQKSLSDFSRFSRLVSLRAFYPFTSSEQALQNISSIAEGTVNPTLKEFLELNLKSSTTPSKKTKAPSIILGVSDERLAQNIHEHLSFKCDISQSTQEILRGIRLFFHKFIQSMTELDLSRAQLGLGHSYSRSKVQFNVNRVDNMIIQSISLLDQLDKDINTFAMRVREWYSWHFPELIKIVPDNTEYAKCAHFIKNKNSLSEDSIEALEALLDHDEQKARNILQAARTSMGMDISDFDMANIETFAQKVVDLANYRKHLQTYLSNKLKVIAPNLSALLGDPVAARLISHSGSLTNLAKCPASTIQILGAEKALFRALKTRGKTPKYGLLFHSTFIGRATLKNKGRISRYLANKSAIAARLDSFAETPTNKYGERLREQVEERLNFYETGKPPTKNIDAMKEVISQLGTTSTPSGKRKASDQTAMEVESPAKKTKKEKKVKEVDMEDVDDEEEEEEETPKKKKGKKADKETPKKKKSEDGEKGEQTPDKKKKKEGERTPKKAETPKKEGAEEADSEKKKKKKKKEGDQTPKKENEEKEEPEKKKKKKGGEQTPKKDDDDNEEPEKKKKKKKKDGEKTPKKAETPKKEETPKKKKKQADEDEEEETPKKKKKKKSSD